MPKRAETVRTLAVLLASAVIFAAMARPMAQGKVYITDDLGNFHLPLRAFYASCLAAGDRFNWCPSLFCGLDLHGEGQCGLFHPWHLLIYRLLPLDLAFNFELLASYPMLFGGTYLLLRRWGLPRDACSLGAMVFALAGFNIYHYRHLNLVAVIAHLPWLLLLADTALRSADSRRVAWARFGVGLLTASQILLGHPQSVLFSALAEGFYAAMLALRGGVTLARLAAWSAAKLLGVLGAGAQLLPSWDALGRSVRHQPTRAFVAFGSLPPANVIQWLAPYAYLSRVVAPPVRIPELNLNLPPAGSPNDWRTHEFGLYVGAIAPVLLGWLALRHRSLGPRKRLVLAAMGLGTIALVLAVGKYSPVFRVSWRMPLMSLFRVPARYVVLVHGAVAVLAAVAFADLARVSSRRQAMPWRALWPLGLLPVASLAITAGVVLLARRWPEPLLSEYIASRHALVAGPVLIFGTTALVVAAARGWSHALVGLLLFAGLDQGVYAVTYLRSFPRVSLAEYAASRKLPPGRPGDRIVRVSAHQDNTQTIRGYSLVIGYAGLAPRRRLDYFKTSSQRVAGAQWLEVEDSDYQPHWTPVPNPMPRARLVSRVVASDDPNRDIDRIDVATMALVDRAPTWPAAEPGTAKIVTDRPGSIDVETNAESPQFLILTEMHHPGWRVLVD
ncbi:MAG TPA: hypothetical protein VGZ22_24960, partial [Isosphaeraceae bacterium]|nr:hypothetical protein [Isosphaeraceae bacterium]